MLLMLLLLLLLLMLLMMMSLLMLLLVCCRVFVCHRHPSITPTGAGHVSLNHSTASSHDGFRH